MAVAEQFQTLLEDETIQSELLRCLSRMHAISNGKTLLEQWSLAGLPSAVDQCLSEFAQER